MKSTLISERLLGRRANLAGSAPDSKSGFQVALARINQELWLVLSLFVIAGLFNWLVASHRMILGLYTLPTIFSAYVYGRRHAVLTASASIFMVLILLWKNTGLFAGSAPFVLNYDQWSELIIWACLLLVTAYAMGTLYDKKERHMRELRQTYFGLLAILQQFISNDKYTHNHSYRVAVYASSIAARMGFDQDRIDDVRAAALLHDVGKLETSRELLHKAANLTPEEMAEMRKHVQKGVALLEPVGGSLRRVLPIILAHHDKFDGSGYGPAKGTEIPVEARVLAVADAYDTLTSDRSYRRAVTPFEARQILVSSAGSNFDPAVVDAFVNASNTERWKSPRSSSYERRRMNDPLAHATGSGKDRIAQGKIAQGKIAQGKTAQETTGQGTTASGKNTSAAATTTGVRILLVSGDIQTIDTLCESMGKMAMHVDAPANLFKAVRSTP